MSFLVHHRKHKFHLFSGVDVNIRRISLSIFVGITVLLVGQVFVNEFLVSFNVETSETAKSGGEIIIQNNGVIQAHDVMAYLKFTDVPKITDHNCLEGIIDSKYKTITIHFDRFSTNIACVIHLEEFSGADVTITSDDRTAHTGKYQELWGLLYFVSAMFFTGAGLVIFATYGFARRCYYKAVFYFGCRGFVPMDCSAEMCSDMQKEFSIKVSDADISILYHISNQRKTLYQIKAHTKLSVSYVAYRIMRLRCHGLVEKDNTPSEFILNYFR